MIILGHISGWIGKELIELLSCIYLYIPLLLSWFIILLRNNSLKRGISILSTIGLLLLLVYYTSDLAKEYIIGVESSEYSKAVDMSAAILVFSLCLFRSRSLLLITLLEGILLYFMLPLLKVIIIFDILYGGILAVIVYFLFTLLDYKLSSQKATWITERYTRSGYAISDIFFLGNILILTGFVQLIGVLWKLSGF